MGIELLTDSELSAIIGGRWVYIDGQWIWIEENR